MKKRLFSVAAVAMALTMALAGCSSSEEKTEEGAEQTEQTEGGEDNVLTVAMECGYAPYNWTQSDDSNGAVQIKDSTDYAYGYDVMMAKKIAEDLGMELEIVKLDWDSLVPAVQSGTVDCVIAGQSITKERLQMVDFTNPYYLSLIHILYACFYIGYIFGNFFPEIIQYEFCFFVKLTCSSGFICSR